jgi:uncharacterized protein YabN with tetrapyrrole methylase and pyrophosphatase domain
MRSAEVDLYIIGTGILGMEHISIQTRETLSRCRKVYHLTSIHDELAGFCGDLVNNAELYWTGKPASEVYRKIIDTIVGEVEKGPGVANLTYGHPLFFDDINMGLIREMKNRGLKYKVIPGISCLDTLSSDLEIDYGDGLQVYEAQDLVFRQHPLNPKVHAIILQIAQFGSNLTIPSVPTAKGRFLPLEKYLAKYYPADHTVSIVFSDRGDSYTDYRVDFNINEFDKNQEKMFKGTTLYIPPVASAVASGNPPTG